MPEGTGAAVFLYSLFSRFFIARWAPLIVLCAAFSGGCRIPPPTAPASGGDTVTYFPIRQFILDQWTTYGGQPFTLEREVSANGKRITDYVQAFSMDWAAVMAPFLEADIGYDRFSGKYVFSQFLDPGTGLLTFAHEADSPGLYTRKFFVNADPETNRIVDIYAETARGDGWHYREQKLYYAPTRTIQITERSTARVGPDKTWTVTYRFIR